MDTQQLPPAAAAAAAADKVLGSDEQAHTTLHLSSRSPKQRKAKASKPAAAAAASTKKLANWTHEDDMQLLTAMQQWVTSTGGMLPGSIRTKKGSPISKSWKDIAKLCDKVQKLEEEDAKAKACSGRWTSLRAASQVSCHARL